MSGLEVDLVPEGINGSQGAAPITRQTVEVVFDTAKPVTRGKQLVKNKDGTEKEVDFVTAWTNLYKGKTRVFSNTIGHNNDTVSDDRYLNFVARGALWATDHLNKDGTAKEGYAK